MPELEVLVVDVIPILVVLKVCAGTDGVFIIYSRISHHWAFSGVGLDDACLLLISTMSLWCAHRDPIFCGEAVHPNVLIGSTSYDIRPLGRLH